jgi:hypothetical protein
MFWSDNHDQTTALHARSILDRACLGQLFYDGIHYGTAHLLVRHFSSTIGKGDFGLVALFEERFHLSDFDFKIVLIGPWAQLDFLHLRGLLVTTVLMILFAQLILILPKVHYSTDWGDRSRSDFHQIVASLLGLAKGIRRLKDAELFSLWANDTNFPDSNFTIHT